MLAGSLTTEDSAFEDVGSFSTGDSDLSLTCDVVVTFSSLSTWDLDNVRDVNLSRDILVDEDLSLSFDVYSLDSNDVIMLLCCNKTQNCWQPIRRHWRTWRHFLVIHPPMELCRLHYLPAQKIFQLVMGYVQMLRG